MKICVFCGGAGTRMWPLSRRSKPKQFQPLIGKKSLFQLMIERLQKGFLLKDIYVVTGAEYSYLVKNQIPELPLENLILEPSMRDTAAAVGYAAAVLSEKFPKEVMVSIWGADHVVRDDDTFLKALKLADELAKKEGVIVKVDVRPTFPSAHTGYIEVGKKIGEKSGFKMYEFIKHVEKPSLEAAKEYLEAGNYLWNTGYFASKIDNLLNLYEKHIPTIHRNLISAVKSKDKGKKVVEQIYSKIPKTSIDYSLFEKLGRHEQIVIEADLGWTDIGAWDALREELAGGKDANVVSANHIGIDTKGSLIYGVDRKKLIATIGLKDMIVVDTGDSLLICPAGRSADIKKIVAKLSEKKKSKFL